jgi:hypothetical protein
MTGAPTSTEIALSMAQVFASAIGVLVLLAGAALILRIAHRVPAIRHLRISAAGVAIYALNMGLGAVWVAMSELVLGSFFDWEVRSVMFTVYYSLSIPLSTLAPALFALGIAMALRDVVITPSPEPAE